MSFITVSPRCAFQKLLVPAVGTRLFVWSARDPCGSPRRWKLEFCFRQVARVTAWATDQQIPIDKVVVEVGSALNGPLVPVSLWG
jgi:hypothetical protein